LELNERPQHFSCSVIEVGWVCIIRGAVGMSGAGINSGKVKPIKIEQGQVYN